MAEITNAFQEDYSGLVYLPCPYSKPFDFDAKWKEIVGTNPVNGEPPLRVVWGMDRKQFINGAEEVYYIDPNGEYVGWPCLIVEAWTSPSVYNELEWEENRYDIYTGRDELGPFPRAGVWDFLKALRDEELNPLPYEAAYEIAREWRYNRDRPQASARALEQKLAFYAERQKRKAAALALHRAKVHEELMKEFNKPDVNAVQTLPAGKPELKNIIIPTPLGLERKDPRRDGN